MDFIWIFVALVAGFLFKQIGLPPLIGYLCVGFGLHAGGIEPFAGLDVLADLGITLMLFTIGLKLDVKALVQLELLGGATGHMAL